MCVKKKNLTNELDKICTKICPSKVVLDMNKYSQKHLNYILNTFNRFVQQFEVSYQFLIEFTRGINYLQKSWPSHRSSQYILLVNNLKTLFSSFN